jgi:hypothetical protein
MIYILIMDTQTCRLCGIEKEISHFYIHDKKYNTYRSECKDCLQSQRIENKNNKKQYNKNYYEINSKSLKEKASFHYKNNEITIRKYRRKYSKKRRITDVNFNLRKIISTAINRNIKSNNATKDKTSVLNFLPYSINDLKQHLENLFEPWMNWKNWGTYTKDKWNDNDPATWTWQIDHIIPHSSFKYTSMQDNEFQRCWDLNNLRPISSKQNLLKGSLLLYKL